jgi:hypothetical protein
MDPGARCRLHLLRDGSGLHVLALPFLLVPRKKIVLGMYLRKSTLATDRKMAWLCEVN